MDTHLGYSEWTPTRAMPASSLPGTAPESRFPPAHGVFIEPGIDNVDTGFRSCVWFQPRAVVRSAGSHRRHGRSMVGWLVWEREGQSFSTGCRHWDRQGRNPGEHVLSIRWRFGYKYYANRVRVEFCFNFPRSCPVFRYMVGVFRGQDTRGDDESGKYANFSVGLMNGPSILIYLPTLLIVTQRDHSFPSI